MEQKEKITFDNFHTFPKEEQEVFLQNEVQRVKAEYYKKKKQEKRALFNVKVKHYGLRAIPNFLISMVILFFAMKNIEFFGPGIISSILNFSSFLGLGYFSIEPTYRSSKNYKNKKEETEEKIEDLREKARKEISRINSLEKRTFEVPDTEKQITLENYKEFSKEEVLEFLSIEERRLEEQYEDDKKRHIFKSRALFLTYRILIVILFLAEMALAFLLSILFSILLGPGIITFLAQTATVVYTIKNFKKELSQYSPSKKENDAVLEQKRIEMIHSLNHIHNIRNEVKKSQQIEVEETPLDRQTQISLLQQEKSDLVRLIIEEYPRQFIKN